MRASFRLFSRAVGVGVLSLSCLALVKLVPTSTFDAPLGHASRVSPWAKRVRPLSGVKVLGWGFDRPQAITSRGTRVWVANFDGNSVTGALGLDRRPGEGHQRLKLRV